MRELLEAARGRWAEIFGRIGTQFREAIEYAGSSRHVDCPVKPGKNGDGFRMFPDWQATGGVVCNSCGEFPTGLSALIWANNWAHDHAVAEIAAVLGIDQPRRRGRPPKPKLEGNATKTEATKNANNNANANSTPRTLPAQSMEIARNRAKLIARWQSFIPDKGRVAAYLESRGIDLAAIGGVPQSIRLAESLEYLSPDPSDPKRNIRIGAFPAMAAQVIHPTLGFVSIHRTYLNPIVNREDHAGKADVPAPKKLTTPIYPGATAGAAVRLFPANTTTALALTEGIETALAIYQATGTPAWSTVSAGGMSSIDLPKEITTVEIWADPGDVGQQAARQAAERLAGEGRKVWVVSPSPDHAAENHDWLDVLISEGPDALKEAREAAQEFRRATGEVRDIYLRTQEHEVVDEIVEAIANDPTIYCRGGQLVHVVSDASRSRPGILRPSVAPRIALLPEFRLRERITAYCRILTKNKEGEEFPIHPPTWAVKETASRCNWPAVRHLEAIVETPILRHDGSIFGEPGYDPITGVVYEPTESIVNSIPKVPASPTTEQISAAVATILEVVRDFPFATPAHQSAWLAAVLTPFARFSFRGPAPLFLVDANVRGAGKSLLCDLVGLIVSGREMARMVNTRADDEMRKRITAIAIAGDPLVLIDNIGDALGGPGLDAALTSSTWSDRILGKSENTVPMPLCATWYATGNNVVLKADIARRICHIRLESPEENPEERSGFAHQNIRGHVYRNRPALIAAALTILRGYTAATADKPELKPSIPQWGSFEGWSDVVRGAIVFAGLADPGQTREQVREESDSEGQTLRAFMSAWEKLDPENLGMTISEAIKRVEEFQENHFQNSSEIKSAFIEFAPGKDSAKLNARSIGMKLHHIKGRIVFGKSFRRKTSKENTVIWNLSITQGTSRTIGTTDIGKDLGSINQINTQSYLSNYASQIYIREDSPNSPSSPVEPNFVEEVL